MSMRRGSERRDDRSRRAGSVMVGAALLLAVLGLVTSFATRALHRPSAPVGYTLRWGPSPTATPTLQDAISSATQLDAAGRPTLLVTAPATVDGASVTEVRLDLQALPGAAVGHVPEGWSAALEDGLLTARGPALDGASLHLRLDLTSAAPLQALAIELRASGRTLLQRVAATTALPPLRVIETLEEALHFPWQIAPGDLVEFEAVPAAGIHAQGAWTIGGTQPTALSSPPGQALRFQWRVPASLTPGAPLSVTWTNPFGQRVVNVPSARVSVVSPPTAAAQVPPRLDDCTPRGFVGRVVCLCGWFPTPSARGGFALAGTPLRVVASSSSSVLVEIPAGAQPGTRTISADPAAGFAPGSSVEIVVLAASGSIDQDRLLRGETTPLRLEVTGTTQPLDIVLSNYTPGIVNVAGGIVQVVRTSGGTPNTAERQVQGIAPGAFDIGYQLAEDPCPCVPGLGGTVVAGGNPPGTPQNPTPPVQGGTRTPGQGPPPGTTGTPPLPPVPPANPPLPPVPPVNPPSGPPPEEDEEEEACCGFREDGTLTFPKITDPLVPAAVAVAPRDPAVGGAQVLLHSGAYFHNQTDLDVDAVGLPFRFSRHYKGDVETVEGGILGHRWDFSLNKRIVPQAARELGTNLLLERPGVETPQLWYFDGQGKGALYEGASSEWRDVLNFGQPTPFRAYVTTYRQLPGDFYEIQRYVLEDPARHPFASHPNVETEQGEAIFYVLRERNGVRYVFNCRGQLLHVLHRNDLASLAGGGVGQPSDSVRISLEYEGALNPLTQNRMLSRVRDPSGHLYGFETRPMGSASLDTNIDGVPRSEILPIPRLKQIRGGGRVISFDYDRGSDGAPLLVAVTDSVGGHSRTWEYGYDSADRLITLTSPQQVASTAIPYLTNRYDGAGRVVEQIQGDPAAAAPQRVQLAYAQGLTTLTDAYGHRSRYELESVEGYPVVKRHSIEEAGGTPPRSWTTTYEHNPHTQITRIVHPRGNEVLFQFDGQDDAVTEGWIRNKGASVTYASDLSAGNLLAVTRVGGSAGPAPSVTTLMSYEPLFNQVEAQEDGRGYRTEYTYDYRRPGDLGNALAVQAPDLTDPEGVAIPVPATEYEYNVRGQPTRSHQGGQREIAWTYDARGYLVQERLPTSAVHTYSRDGFGRLLGEGGDLGEVAYELDPFGRVERTIQDPAGFANVTETRYDRDGLPLSVRRELKDNFASATGAPPPERPRWVDTRFEYDVLGRVVREVKNPGGAELVVETAYDAAGRLWRATQPGPAGAPVTDRYEYDARGLAVRAWSAEGTDQEVRVTTEFDANGNEVREERTATRSPTGTTPGAPRTRRFEYDGLDRLVGEVDPLGSRTTFALDADGNLVEERVSDAAGAVISRIEHTIDEWGNEVQSVHHALDGNGQIARSQVFLNGFGERVRTVGPAGGVAHYLYDSGGRLTEVVTPGGDTTRTRYDRAGNQVEVIQIEVGETMQADASRTHARTVVRMRYAYDALGRVVREERGGNVAETYYDSFDNLRSTRLDDGTADSIRYDVMGRKWEHKAGGTTKEYRYGPNGLPVEVSDGRSRVVLSYDASGQIREEARTGSGVTRYARDGLGNPLRVTDANGTVITSTFNGVGLPVEQRFQAGTSGGSSLPSVIVPNEIRWEYDGLGRVTLAEVSHPVSSAPVRTRRVYDGLGRVTREEQSIDGESYPFSYAYGRDHRTETLTYPAQAGSLEVFREVDVIGRLRVVTADGRAVASYAHDGPARVSGRRYPNGAVTRYRVDGEGRLGSIRVTATSGFPTPKPLWSDTASYGRYGFDWMVQTWERDASGEWSESLTELAFDNLGRVTRSSTLSTRHQGTQIVSRDRSSLFNTYSADRLVGSSETLFDLVAAETRFVRVDTFQHDSVGRQQDLQVAIGTQIPGSGTLLASSTDIEVALASATDPLQGTKHFTYDRRGQLISDGELRYAYDHEGRLMRVEEIGTGAQRGEAVQFLYDAFGRRVRSFPLAPPQSTGLVGWGSWAREVTHFLYDGSSVVAEIAPPTQGAPPPVLRRRYVLGARPGERVRMEHFTGTGAPEVFYPHEGIQATVGFVTDAIGQVARLDFTSPPAGVGFSVPDDIRTVEGSSARAPYLSWSTRVDGFAGSRTDELTGAPQIDYRTIRSLADSAGMRRMSRSVATASNHGALLLGAASSMAVASMVGGALLAGGAAQLTWSGVATSMAISSGLETAGGAAVAWYTGDATYGYQTFLRDAGTGAAFGLIGARMMAAEWSAIEAFAGEQVLQNPYSTARGVLAGRSVGEAFSRAVIENGLATAMAGGVAALGRGAAALGARLRSGAAAVEGGVIAARRSRPTPTGTFERGGFIGKADPRNFRATGIGTKRIDHLLKVVLTALDSGTPIARRVADALRDGTLKVRLANFNDPSFHGFHWSRESGILYVNTEILYGPFALGPLQVASTIVHEGVHAFGGGEIAAHVAQAQFMVYVLKRTGALRGNRLRVSRARWLDPTDLDMVQAWWRGRKTGQFEDLTKILVRPGHYGTSSNPLLVRGPRAGRHIEAAGGFARLLGVDAKWAAAAGKRYDYKGSTGHWE